MWQQKKKKVITKPIKQVDSEIQCDLFVDENNYAREDNSQQNLSLKSFISMNYQQALENGELQAQNFVGLKTRFNQRFLASNQPGFKKLKLTNDFMSILGLLANLKDEENLEASKEDLGQEEIRHSETS